MTAKKTKPPFRVGEIVETQWMADDDSWRRVKLTSIFPSNASGGWSVTFGASDPCPTCGHREHYPSPVLSVQWIRKAKKGTTR